MRQNLVQNISLRIICLCLVLNLLHLCASFAIDTNPSLKNQIQKWDGPTTGPIAQTNKTIVYIASDFKNGGVTNVFRGFETAAIKLGWKVTLEDGLGNKATQEKILSSAIASKADGIVISGFQAEEFSNLIATAKKLNIKLIGWHSGAQPGPTNELFFNVTTNPIIVASLAADFVIQDAKAKKKNLGVIIFNDNQYKIANLKTQTMKDSINKCKGYKGCKVLSVENISISEANSEIPEVIPKLVTTYGDKWTYTLAINDVYFDSINFPLLNSKRPDISLVSAGDGSEVAIRRIKSGNSLQIATIAEPLRMQGFQIADEMNRAFAGKLPSGYVSKPIIITKESLKTAETISDSAYEDAYFSIWNGLSK